jgi:pimeloyl-ACP methyl ester carboxylesterase
MKKFIHAGWVVVLLIIFISLFVSAFGVSVPTVSAMAIVPHTCCSSVAFIPGIEGSRLYAPGLFTENKLWEPFWNGDLDKLDMNSDGQSLRGDIYTRDIVDYIKIGLINTPYGVYGDFGKYLDGLVTDKKISEWGQLPYDWRLSFDDIVDGGVQDPSGNISFLSSTTPEVSYMISQLQSLASHSFTGKVTLIAHSNGGLVAKALIQKLEDLKARGQSDLLDKIDKVIMVAVPQTGAVSAAATILHGYNIHYLGGLIANEGHGRAMAENMPGAYNLLPSQKYFENNTESLITFATSTDSFSNFSKIYGRNISSFSIFEKFLAGADGRSDPNFDDTNSPNVLNRTLLTNADNIQSALGAWQFPSTISVIQVAGIGIKTLSGIEYDKGSVCSTDFFACKDVLDPEPITSDNGDGTVLASSALSGQGTQFYFDLNRYNNPEVGTKHNAQHTDIMGTKNIQDLITNMLAGENNLPDLITMDKPTTDVKQLLIVAHSPISIDAYDAQGNHTGLINNPDPNSDIQLVEQNIPNSFYSSFGEGKYLSVGSETSVNIVFQGLDYGSFTLDTTLFQGDDIIATSTFVDIPVTPQLKGRIIDTSSSVPALALDVDGDGIVDVVATSTPTFNPVLYIEIMKKTIDSFDLKKPVEKTLIKKLDQLENLIGKGKLKNAGTQVRRFIKKINRTNKRLRKIDASERNQLVQMLSNLVDNLL